MEEIGRTYRIGGDDERKTLLRVLEGSYILFPDNQSGKFQIYAEGSDECLGEISAEELDDQTLIIFNNSVQVGRVNETKRLTDMVQGLDLSIGVRATRRLQNQA